MQAIQFDCHYVISTNFTFINSVIGSFLSVSKVPGVLAFLFFLFFLVLNYTHRTDNDLPYKLICMMKHY